MHLLIEEVNHLLLREPEGDVADVDSPGLASDGGADNGHSGLESESLQYPVYNMMTTECVPEACPASGWRGSGRSAACSCTAWA